MKQPVTSSDKHAESLVKAAFSAPDAGDVTGLGQGEIEALFQRHNDELVHYLTGRLKSRDEAVEVAQEAYVRLLRLDDTSTIGFLRAFLFKTAANIAIDRQRKQGRDRAYAEEERADVEKRVFSFTPERELAGRQSLAKVVTCIEGLPEKCRHAFVEYKFRHRDYDEIAGEMGISSSMVRKYVLRALVHCAAQLGDELDAWSR